MINIAKYLSECRDIHVSSSDAEDLGGYWKTLSQQRSNVDESALAGEEIPILFNPILVHDKVDDTK